MTAIALALIGWILPSRSMAYDVKVDDIYYNLNQEEKTAEVTYATSSSMATSLDYTDDVAIPSSFEYQGTTYKVTSIGNFAFFNCAKLNTVSIPDGIIAISDFAFFGCSSLATLFIPVSVIHIGKGVMIGMESLIMPGVTIGDGAIVGAYSLVTKDIPDLDDVSLPDITKKKKSSKQIWKK